MITINFIVVFSIEQYEIERERHREKEKQKRARATECEKWKRDERPVCVMVERFGARAFETNVCILCIDLSLLF